MEIDKFIAAHEFCGYHQIEYTFIDSLSEAGLLQITTVNQVTMIPQSELPRLERLIRLHQDLDINLAGLEAIVQLLDKVTSLQQNVTHLRNRLNLYE